LGDGLYLNIYDYKSDTSFGCAYFKVLDNFLNISFKLLIQNTSDKKIIITYTCEHVLYFFYKML